MQVRASKLRYQGTRPEQQDFVNLFQVVPSRGSGSYAAFVLTDGIGGLCHGREAGEVVNVTASRAVRERLLSAPTSDRALHGLLREAARTANDELRRFRESNRLGACGATLIACVLFESNLFFLSIGDSIILTLSSEKKLSRINKAHVRPVGDRNHLYSAVLGGDIAEIDEGKVDLGVRHISSVLLSSDGLSTIPESKVTQILNESSEGKLDQIVGAAKSVDGMQDNLSMILLEVI